MDAKLAAMLVTLENHFRNVADTGMVGLPIINPALAVQAVGFRASPHGWLGVLITPWFISLVLLPRDADWQDHPLESRQRHVFPSGRYEFLVAEADGVGRYQCCSLLSPVQEIADQATAVQFALSALLAVRQSHYRDAGSHLTDDHPDSRSLSRRDFLRRCLPHDQGESSP